MKNISLQLQQFIKVSIHPTKLAGQSMTVGELEKWGKFIDTSVAELAGYTFKSALILSDRKTSIFEVINLITELSNTLNEYLTKYTKVWQKNPMAIHIRQRYLSTCVSLENFLDDLASKYPKIASQTVHTHYANYRIRQELRLLVSTAILHLKSREIDMNIIKMFTDGMNHLINLRNIKRADDNYIRKLVDLMIKKRFTESAQVIDFLIIHDFNLPDFFLFCLELWNDRLTEQDGLIEQKEKLLDMKSHLFELSISSGLKNPWEKHRIYNELNKYLSEKYFLVKERLKISLSFLDDERYSTRQKRMQINLSVAQLGLFLRLLVEKGVLAKEHIGELFAFYARHFYTPNTDFISAESLQKKSSVVEHATAQKLKALLISMLNWLNTNYNLSNYN